MTKKINDMISVLTKYTFVINSIEMMEVTCVICKGILKNAAQSTCGCNFCLECIKNYLGNSSKLCPSGRTCCSDELLSIEKDIQIDHRVNRNIALLVVKCPNNNCEFEDHLGNIGSHLRICVKNDIRCPFTSIGCNESNISKDQLFDHLQSNILSHSGLVTESIENIGNELAVLRTLKDELAETKATASMLLKQLEEQKLEIELLKVSNEKLTQTIEELTCNGKKNYLYQDLLCKVNDLEKSIDKISNATKTDDFIWKIDDFSSKQKCVMSMFKKELSSSAFYTHKGGYRLRLKMHPSGYGNGINTHLFVSFCIMKGDFDDKLEWPFKHVVTLSLINQSTGSNHKSYSFSFAKISSEFADSFQKPKSQMNKALGDDEFISFEELYSNCDLLKDDSIVIKCSVHIP